MFNLNRLGKKPAPAPKPRAEISGPLPGSARPIPGRSVKPNPIPAQEYPHSRPAPNTLVMRGEDGRVHLERLPQGATLSRPFEAAPAPRSDRVDIGSLTWPANGHYSRKLEDLREAHRRSLDDLHAARLDHPYVSRAERRELTPSELKARKQEVGREARASKEQIHALEKAERQARREVDVFKSRFAKELTAEADFREGRARLEAARPLPPAEKPLPPTPDEPPAIPARPAVLRAARPRPASAPDLAPIAERPESRSDASGISVLSHATRAASALSEASSHLPPHLKELRGLQEEYRRAKNAYHGMKPEAARHGREAVAAAKAEYKAAEKALDAYLKANRGEIELERAGYRGPTLDDLREALRPGMGGDDKYPAFPPSSSLGSQQGRVGPKTIFPGRRAATSAPGYTPSTVTSPIPSPLPTPPLPTGNGPQVPRVPADPIPRPGNPGPDHPRNRPASPDFGLEYYGI